jgi:hypothetical protein
MADEKDIAVLQERVDNWMKTTEGYREQLCEKIDRIDKKMNNIFDKLSQLPCDKRIGWYESIAGQVRVLWIFITAIIMVIVGGYFELWKR